jgi:mRNA interferase RelE/StbE
MPIRVELVADAIADLEGLATSGNIRLFLAKLVRLEAVGKDAGQPLRSELTGLRKIVVGNRDWRIIFRMNTDDTVATVWVIGDRNDSECYQEAVRRLRQAEQSKPEISGFAAVILSVLDQRSSKKAKKKKR